MKVHAIKRHELFSIMDLGELVRSPEDLGSVLNVLVERVSKLMGASACSLFLFDKIQNLLVLKATSGLNPDLVDKLSIKPGQGLTGKTLELRQPISVANAQKSENFFPVANSGEEKYSSFLSVPLVYNANPIGVIILQNETTTKFRKKDIDFLMTLSIPAVSIIEKAKFMETIGAMSTAKGAQITPDKPAEVVTYEYLKDHFFRGIPAVPGIGMGRLKIITTKYAQRHDASNAESIEQQIEHLRDAFLYVSNEIRETKKQAETKFGPDEASIFEAYLLFLESDNFQQQIINEIRAGQTAVQSLKQVVNKYIERLALAKDEYIKERAYDIQDIARKISDRLLYGETSCADNFQTTENTVFFNAFWSVSDFVNLDHKKTKGLISPSGGATSHISILADTLNIPTVLGLSAKPEQLRDGDFVIVDGYAGSVIINPTKTTIEIYKREIEELNRRQKIFSEHKDKHLRLGDNTKHAFPIGANLSMAVHAKTAIDSGADLIGLYRTEFPFLIRKQMPTEEDQFLIYKRVIELVKDKTVVFRTLDIGGDKYVSYLNLPKENNPALGWRAIRFSLERKDLFRIQLRAILRASVYGKIKLLLPMVTSLDELQHAKAIIESVKKELTDESVAFAKHIPLGIMIEVPAAVEIADFLAREVDFFSLGTNDLVQYTLAVDRSNPVVAHLYDPYHPAVLRLIHRTIIAAHQANIKVGVCGDIAAQPLLAAFLMGLGIDTLSMTPRSIPKIKFLGASLNEVAIASLAQRCLGLPTGKAVRAELEAFFTEQHLEMLLQETRATVAEAEVVH